MWCIRTTYLRTLTYENKYCKNNRLWFICIFRILIARLSYIPIWSINREIMRSAFIPTPYPKTERILPFNIMHPSLEFLRRSEDFCCHFFQRNSVIFIVMLHASPFHFSTALHGDILHLYMKSWLVPKNQELKIMRSSCSIFLTDYSTEIVRFGILEKKKYELEQKIVFTYFSFSIAFGQVICESFFDLEFFDNSYISKKKIRWIKIQYRPCPR